MGSKLTSNDQIGKCVLADGFSEVVHQETVRALFGSPVVSTGVTNKRCSRNGRCFSFTILSVMCEESILRWKCKMMTPMMFLEKYAWILFLPKLSLEHVNCPGTLKNAIHH